jgi:large subunit ribosomal protein L10
MPLKLKDKEVIVAEVAEVAASAQAAIIAEYRGMSVAEMTELRKLARREGNVYVRVVRNTLARRAVANTAFACMQDALTGPVVLAFSRQEPSAVARVIGDFIKTNKKLEVKGIALSGRFLPATDLNKVAKLPTRDQALSLMMSAMKAPISKFVRTLAEPHAKLVRTVAAIRDSKQQST